MKLNGKEYKLNLTGYTLVIYKQEFKEDMLKSLGNLKDNSDVTTLLQFIWAFAKTSNKDIPDFEEFANSITNLGELLSKETFKELTDCIKKCSFRSVEQKKA